MSATASTDTVHGIGPRVRAWLRTHYPKGQRAKAVARQLKISEPLANKLLQGYCPRMWLFEEMVALWDGPFLATLFPEAMAAADARVQQLEEEIRALRAELAAVRAGVDGLADGGSGRRPALGDDASTTEARSARIGELVRALVDTVPVPARGEDLVA